MGSCWAAPAASAAGCCRGGARCSESGIGPKTGLERTADVLEKLADGLGSVAGQASSTTDDVHKIREQLDQANRQSPVEVLLDGLTHRRGAHKREK